MKVTFRRLAGMLQVIAVLLACVVSASASDTQGAAPTPRSFVSNHQVTIGGHVVRYRATVAEQFVVDSAGKRLASLFTTSYERTDLPKGDARPVLFVFNGGPGSASLWLHLGLVGPRRIDFDDPAHPRTVAPFSTVENTDSPLDAADIVLIDPPGTGFSTILADGKPAQFYTSKADALATVKVIKQWIDQHHRWNAPKFLLGESYGTIRAALVARMITGGVTETGELDGLSLNGVILIGQALNLNQSGDMHYVTSLPTLAATACYFHRLPASCSPTAQAEAVKRFAGDDYLRALYQGERLDATERTRIAAQLSAWIGIPANVIEAHDLRIDNDEFAKLLLADQGKALGMFDARFTLPSKASGDDPVADDSAMVQYSPGFIAAFNQYIREDLGVRLDLPYKAVSFKEVEGQWDYGDGQGVPLNKDFAPDLATAMRRNPSLRLMVASGLYDLVTTAGDADYTMAHAGIPLERVQFHVYPSGHMAYLSKDARGQVAADIRAFVASGR
jgi:carboxypeptidase C (cathepsin A)